MINHDRVVGRRDRVVVQQVEGESVLLDIDSGEYFSLNSVGGRVWELADGTHSVGAIIDTICAEYDVDPEIASRDTGELIDNLAGVGLVVEH